MASGRFADLSGKRFGRLTVLSLAEKPDTSKDAHKWWSCKCDCGNVCVVSGANLGRSTLSCGCIKKESKPVTHGFASHRQYSKLYHTWNAIKYRCNNPKSKDFANYGERGISICTEWENDFLAFYKWAMQNGYSPELTIDRIDNNGNYCPENCRWVTTATQNTNKRNAVLLSYNGKTMCCAEWERELGLNRNTVLQRYHRGWNVEECLHGRQKHKKGGNEVGVTLSNKSSNP